MQLRTPPFHSLIHVQYIKFYSNPMKKINQFVFPHYKPVYFTWVFCSALTSLFSTGFVFCFFGGGGAPYDNIIYFVLFPCIPLLLCVLSQSWSEVVCSAASQSNPLWMTYGWVLHFYWPCKMSYSFNKIQAAKEEFCSSVFRIQHFIEVILHAEVVQTKILPLTSTK